MRCTESTFYTTQKTSPAHPLNSHSLLPRSSAIVLQNQSSVHEQRTQTLQLLPHSISVVERPVQHDDPEGGQQLRVLYDDPAEFFELVSELAVPPVPLSGRMSIRKRMLRCGCESGQSMLSRLTQRCCNEGKTASGSMTDG